MISFKDFLNEKRYVKSGEKEWELILQGYVPLNDWLFRKKGMTEIKIDKVYRTESLRGIKNYGKGGMKVQLPTFTKGSEGLADGALVSAMFLLELEGKTFGRFNLDAWTVLDRNGKRWIYPDTDTTIKLQKRIAKKLGFPEDDFESYQMVKTVDKMSGKEKKDFISWYYKMASKILPKDYIERINKKLEQSSKNLIDNDIGNKFANDEILLHEYKLRKVWFIKEESKLFSLQNESKDYIKKAGEKGLIGAIELYVKDNTPKGTKFCGFISKKDIIKIDLQKGRYPKC